MLRRVLQMLFAVFALAALSAGTQCAFVLSGHGSSDEDDEQNDVLLVIRTGRFVDAPVEGLSYRSGPLSGVTDEDGRFDYPEGGTVVFSIGDIVLGQATPGKAIVTPLDLVDTAAPESPAVINIARLLLSLDALPGDDRITLPPRLRAAALRSNTGISASLETLDFEDDTAFINAASQIVATLTADYGFTTGLVDAETAAAHLDASLAALGIEPALSVQGATQSAR